MDVWRVERHGGHTNNRWRIIGRGPEFLMRGLFAETAEGLKRGAVRLVEPLGRVVRSHEVAVRPTPYEPNRRAPWSER